MSACAVNGAFEDLSRFKSEQSRPTGVPRNTDVSWESMPATEVAGVDAAIASNSTPDSEIAVTLFKDVLRKVDDLTDLNCLSPSALRKVDDLTDRCCLFPSVLSPFLCLSPFVLEEALG